MRVCSVFNAQCPMNTDIIREWNEKKKKRKTIVHNVHTLNRHLIWNGKKLKIWEKSLIGLVYLIQKSLSFTVTIWFLFEVFSPLSSLFHPVSNIHLLSSFHFFSAEREHLTALSIARSDKVLNGAKTKWKNIFVAFSVSFSSFRWRNEYLRAAMKYISAHWRFETDYNLCLSFEAH